MEKQPQLQLSRRELKLAGAGMDERLPPLKGEQKAASSCRPPTPILSALNSRPHARLCEKEARRCGGLVPRIGTEPIYRGAVVAGACPS